MASSDEEGEVLPDCVTDYHFVDEKGQPTSFSILPLRWNNDETLEGSGTQAFLRGIADNGLQQIYKKVIAWKLELSYVLPEIYVLTKENWWIKLQRPRKSFQDAIKTIMITIHCLHHVKKNPEVSRDALWNHMLKAFSSHEVEPSEDDLLDHMLLVKQAVLMDKDLAKSQENRTTKRYDFIVDTYDEYSDDGDDECHNSQDMLFDYVCALCDNGGQLLCCEGRCIRSFHATLDAGAESFCESLGFTDAQVEAIPSFVCKNCQYQQHQCFTCGMLGSSDKSSGAEVFPCVSATCGHFYHPNCVAKLLHPWDEIQAEILQQNIFAGESFTCPAHKCFLCKQGEDKKVDDLQFAVCRRCPKAYHRKCLPRKIVFASNYVKNIQQRAWDGLLPNRILIYCTEHDMIPEIGTPARAHILFPDDDGKKKRQISGLPLSKEKVMTGKRSKLLGNFGEKTAVEMQKKVERTSGDIRSGHSIIEKGVTKKCMKDNSTYVPAKVGNSSIMDKSQFARNKPSVPLLRKEPYLLKSKQQHVPMVKTQNMLAAPNAIKKASSIRPLVDAEMENRMLRLMEDSTSSFNMEDFVKKQKIVSSSSYSQNFVLDKSITMGKVERSVNAIRAALKKLEEGGTIEDAQAVCEPEVLNQIIRWKRKLSVYLAPFILGMRYTSFGRHFTKVDKLKEIVDRLHCYVQDGDMIVDFCCGSNDFSCLMKEKLEKMGKRCSFKNYDLITPKNDFSFEKRDWMSVHTGELPAGSRMIMGLNPPFGVQASLANKFIDKALSFKPKLLILIVPKETRRLDTKEHPYDLIWEDDQILAGKSFYLPGSVDVHDQQLDQWNMDPPPLYLWSHPVWTGRHKAIAQESGHFNEVPKNVHIETNNVKGVVSNYLMEEAHDCYGDFSNFGNSYADICSILDDIPEESDYTPGNTVVPGEKEAGPSVTDDETRMQFNGRGGNLA